MAGVIAVTGASGFVGRALCASLRAQGRTVLPLVRAAAPTDPIGARAVGDMGPEALWSSALQGIDCVVHCAARVHVVHEEDTDPLGAFRRVNVDGTRALAVAAAAAGVRRLVFLSTLKVHGEQTFPGTPFHAQSTPAPQDAYGQSKWEAEQALRTVSAATGLDVVVVRPPLVYGPGVKANFLRLMQSVAKGFPLPLGGIHNLRSLLALGNLTDLLQICADHPAAAGQTFLASDDQDLSTPELIRGLATAMGRRATLLPVPVSWLRLAGRLTGQTPQIDRLIGSLQVDIGHTREVLSWSPPWTVQQGLKHAVQDVRR